MRKIVLVWATLAAHVGKPNLLQVVGGIKSGLTLQQQMNSFLEAAHACREGGVSGRLRQVLKAQLQRCGCWY
jgi:NAD(P)H-dependent FMN reductase